MPADEQRDTFGGVLRNSLDDECSFAIVQQVRQELKDRIDAWQEAKSDDPLVVSGDELKDVLESVTFLDSDLQLRTLPAADLAMGYRTSIFEQNPDWCILSATVVLHRGDGAAVLARMQELLGKRREKQPLEWPSAGSTFKRPQGAFAGKLIEDCGLRGFTVGGAQISEKHCGFVINRGGATCADVVALTEQVRQIVEARTGFVLEREIRVVK